MCVLDVSSCWLLLQRLAALLSLDGGAAFFWMIEMDYIITTGIAAAVFGGALVYIVLKMTGRL